MITKSRLGYVATGGKLCITKFDGWMVVDSNINDDPFDKYNGLKTRLMAKLWRSIFVS